MSQSLSTLWGSSYANPFTPSICSFGSMNIMSDGVEVIWAGASPPAKRGRIPCAPQLFAICSPLVTTCGVNVMPDGGKQTDERLPLWNGLEPPQPNEERLKRAIECLLFISEKPLRISELKEVLEVDASLAQRLLSELMDEYDKRSGLAILEVAGGYQMVTRPEYAFYVSKLRQPRRIRLSRAALETLAIIAYRQPITHPEIEHIRGVDSSGCIARLLELGLVRVAGRKSAPGRPYLYATTERFLDVFGLKDLSELPPVEQWHMKVAEAGINLPQESEQRRASIGNTKAMQSDGSHMAQ